MLRLVMAVMSQQGHWRLLKLGEDKPIWCAYLICPLPPPGSATPVHIPVRSGTPNLLSSIRNLRTNIFRMSRLLLIIASSFITLKETSQIVYNRIIKYIIDNDYFNV